MESPIQYSRRLQGQQPLSFTGYSQHQTSPMLPHEAQTSLYPPPHFETSNLNVLIYNGYIPNPTPQHNWLSPRTGNSRPASASTTPTFTFLTPSSVATQEGTSSAVIVTRKRRCSANSNQTSAGESECQALSTSDLGGWEQTASSGGLDIGAGLQSDMPYRSENHGYVIPDLWNPEPRTVPDPYQFQHQSLGGNATNSMLDSNVTYECTTDPQFAMMPPTLGLQNEVDPWTPVQPKRTGFKPGDVAFICPAGPAGHQDPDVLRYGMTAISSSLAHEEGSRHQQTKARSRRTSSKEKEVLLHEEKTGANSGMQYVFVSSNETPKSRTGVRNGQLDPKTRAKAKRVRRKGACWNCWLQKTTCDEDETCHRCKKNYPPGALQVCSRAGFRDYMPAFFPEYHVAHLKNDQVIEEFINENTVDFSANIPIDVEVSTGEVFRYMVLQVYVFKPKTSDILQQTMLVQGNTNVKQFMSRDCAPVGLLGVSQSELMTWCNKHIEDMIQNRDYAAQTTAGDDTELPCTALEIVQQYCAAKHSPLIQAVLKLHAIHYFMRMVVTFSGASARDVYPYMQRHRLCSEPVEFLSSRLLNRQLKHIVHKLHKDILAKVLEHLEKTLKLRDKEDWGCCFCTILILALCIEDLQTAISTFVLADIEMRGSNSKLSRTLIGEACQELEERPFEQPKRLFHEIYKSKRGGHGTRDNGFNPLQAVCDGLDTGLDPVTDQMVKSVYAMTVSSWEEIVNRSQKPSIASLEFGLKPSEIRRRYTGHLAANFLRSFFNDV